MTNTIVLQKQLLIMLEEPTPTTKKETYGKLDSGSTSHFIITTCPGKTVQHKPMTVTCANTTTMDSIGTKEINLNLPLSKKGKIVTVMNDIDDNLISIKQLCDDNCSCLLQKKETFNVAIQH